MALKLQTHFLFSFCFHLTTVIFLPRLYEVSEDKKPECGVEMVLVALEDCLRLSTDAYTPLLLLFSFFEVSDGNSFHKCG